jgi:hypothetical protein
MACLEGRNFTIKLYPQDVRRIMRRHGLPSTGIVFPSTDAWKQIHANGSVQREISTAGDDERKSRRQ